MNTTRALAYVSLALSMVFLVFHDILMATLQVLYAIWWKIESKDQ